MIFYVSGNYTADFCDWLVERNSPILTSYAYPRILQERVRQCAPLLRASGRKMLHMLDSGAFTMWASGGSIDLERYADTCNRMQDEYGDVFDWTFVSLDVIAGEKGRAATKDEVAAAATAMVRNYDYLLKKVRGVVKPVFHTGDPGWVLDHYLASGAANIGIGMNQNLPEDARVAFAAKIGKALPDKKLHGLAATGHAMMRACDWHSVDSAAWQYCASMGGINLMRPGGQLIAVPVSVESPAKHELNRHVSTLPPMIVRRIEELAAQRDTTIEKLSTIYQERWKWNVIEYEAAAEAAAASRAIRAPHYQEGLFND